MTDNKVGRPTGYDISLVDKTRKYIESAEATLYPLVKTSRSTGQTVEYRSKVQFPSIAGLSLYLGVARSSIYKWRDEHPEFSDILEELLAKQEEMLLKGGISGDFNSTITKLVLHKHGYNEKIEQDITSDGEPVTGFLYVKPE